MAGEVKFCDPWKELQMWFTKRNFVVMERIANVACDVKFCGSWKELQM